MPDDVPRGEFSVIIENSPIITQAIEAENPRAKGDFKLEFQELIRNIEGDIFLEVFFYNENTLVIHFCFNGQDKTYVGVLNGRDQKITQFVYFKDGECTSADFNFDKLTIKQFAEVPVELAENIIEILSAQENIPTEVRVEVTERLLISGAEARKPDTLRWDTAAVEAARASIAAVNTGESETIVEHPLPEESVPERTLRWGTEAVEAAKVSIEREPPSFDDLIARPMYLKVLRQWSKGKDFIVGFKRSGREDLTYGLATEIEGNKFDVYFFEGGENGNKTITFEEIVMVAPQTRENMGKMQNINR